MTTTPVRQRQRRSTEPFGPAGTKSRLPTLLSVVALAAALLSAGLAAQIMLTQARVAALGQEVRAGDISLKFEEAGWLTHNHGSDDHDDLDDDPQTGQIQELTAQGQVFPMPASMMPDMPEEGQQRLQVEVTLQNLGDQPRTFGPDEFRLHSANGEVWLPMMRNSFGAGTLEPGQAYSGVFAFDIDETATDLYLVWSRGGTRVRLPVDDPTGHHQ